VPGLLVRPGPHASRLLVESDSTSPSSVELFRSMTTWSTLDCASNPSEPIGSRRGYAFRFRRMAESPVAVTATATARPPSSRGGGRPELL
jgi:hypothetical protein